MITIKNIDPPDASLVPPGMELTGEYESCNIKPGDIYLDCANVWQVAREHHCATFIVALTRPKAPVLPRCPWCGGTIGTRGSATSSMFWVACSKNGCFAGPDFPTREQAISETIRVFGKGSEE